jgi:hypothetical protein
MMLHECFYRSVLHHVATALPSGIAVIEGESYGVRQVDPRIKSPSVTVTIRDTNDAAVELGSDSSVSFQVLYTISAKSRLQRDAVKDIIYSGILHRPITIYSDFDGFVPTVDSNPLRYCQRGDYFRITDVPVFEADREKFFWTSVVYTEYVVV